MMNNHMYWKFTQTKNDNHKLMLEGKEYTVGDSTAALCHVLLLLVDSINNLDLSIELEK